MSGERAFPQGTVFEASVTDATFRSPKHCERSVQLLLDVYDRPSSLAEHHWLSPSNGIA